MYMKKVMIVAREAVTEIIVLEELNIA